jgi:hypothetical protein
MQALLSFDRAPPFAAPLRFFLTGPLFLVAAALLLLLAGPDLFASRWSPALLAATHLVTVGFMLQVMLGALIQILPVVAGANLARPLALARWLHVALSLGALLLAGGFLGGQPELLGFAAGLLGLGVAVFLGAAIHALAGVPSTSPTIRGLKLALFGLAGAVGLGCLLALALARGWSVPLIALADLHAGWALGAWSGVLLAAMSYVVVPMFQLTKGYPAKPSWWFPVVLFGLLILWSAAVAIDAPLLIRLAIGLAALAGIAFAVFTLRLLARRRRARADATTLSWQFGLVCTILALSMPLTAAVYPKVAELPGWSQAFGVLLLVGGFVSFIVGMLYKIVPFLAWLHLQNLGGGVTPAPNMNRLLPGGDMQRQIKLHLLAVMVLLAAAIWPEWFARPSGILLALASGWLLWNLTAAIRRYRRHAADLAGKAPSA